jgi:hypothetical protein
MTSHNNHPHRGRAFAIKQATPMVWFRYLVLFAVMTLVALTQVRPAAAAMTWWEWNLDSTGLVGTFTSMAVDSSGNRHVAYYDQSNHDLKYVWFDGDPQRYEWTAPVTVDSAGDVGQYTSLAVGSNGTVYISYYDATNGDLKYARKAVNGAWVIVTVDSTGNTGLYGSIAVDSDGNLHISYYNQTNGNLRYATKVDGVWHKETVDSAGDVGRFTSITVRKNGQWQYPHISYSDTTNGDLKFAQKNPGVDGTGVWSIETVDSAGIVGLYTSIKLSAVSLPRIAYYDLTNSDLKYAWKSWGGVGNWRIETVDSAGDVGQYASLAVDRDSNAHVSYYDATSQELLYAKKANGVWTTENVWWAGVQLTNAGLYSSIAVGSSGTIHISYYDLINRDLRYVYGF